MKKLLLTLLTTSVFILYSCKKDDAQPVAVALPELSTTAAKDILSTTATTGGNITMNGGDKVTARGVVWNTATAPTIKLSTKTSDGTGKGSFTSKLTKLTPSIKYYVRAYATNSAGTGYGNQVTFTTEATTPTLNATTAVTDITNVSAKSGGNVTDDGGAVLTAQGVVWGTANNPTLANSKTDDVTANGSFMSDVTGLMKNTMYYLRAYATNSAGTTYGNEVSFKTKNPFDGDKKLTTQAEVEAFGADNVTSITGDLIIQNNGTDNINDLSSLSTIISVGGDLNISDNDVPTSLAGLENLTSVGGYLYIYNNDALTSLSGLENIISVGGYLIISDNDVLTSLARLSLTSVGGDLSIEYNNALTSLSGLENVTSVGKGLIINDNDALTSLSGLENVTSVGEELSIEDNAKLTSVAGLEKITSVGGYVLISDNSVLTSLAGLSLTSVGSFLSILDNAKLTDLCGIRSLLVAEGLKSTYKVSGNAHNPTKVQIKDPSGCKNP